MLTAYVLSRHGIGKMQNKGLRLLSSCYDSDLQLSTTLFQIPAKQKNKWIFGALTHDRPPGHWHYLKEITQQPLKITGLFKSSVA